MAEALRKIIHIDMDCFFAAIEMRNRPEIRHLPVAVGGLVEQRGVIATANYKAREYGVRSAMSTHQALKLCPDLVLTGSNFQLYRDEAQKIRKIFWDYTSLVEPLSLDEAYLDVTDCALHGGIATEIAREIRHKIFTNTELTASAGIAPNKFLAKIASDWKKPNGQFTISPDKVDAFIKKLPVKKIHGVGKVTAHKLSEMGFHVCEDLQKADLKFLLRNFGKWGALLHERSFGIDRRPVTTERVRKSLSVEITFTKDLTTETEINDGFEYVYKKFLERFEKSGLSLDLIQGYTVKLKFFNFVLKSKDRRSSPRLPARDELKTLLWEAWNSESLPVRLIGVGVNLGTEASPQLNLWDDN